MDGLDDDRLCNVAGRDRSAKIVDAETPSYRCHRIIHPPVGPIGRVPKMMVSVDNHEVILLGGDTELLGDLDRHAPDLRSAEVSSVELA